jgi:5'-nucleotidase
MAYILLTNDDGVHSPALVPFARALTDLGRVEVVVPDRERSWIGKAITRHVPVEVQKVEREGLVMHAASGYPADCTQIGAHSLFDETPDLVVSGINIGYNSGLAFMMSSGTVGAAAEAWISGLSAVAVSAGTVDEPWAVWSKWVWEDDARPMWDRLATTATAMIEVLLGHDYPPDADVISINMPSNADGATSRRVTSLAQVGYDRLFAPMGGGRFRHEFGGGFRELAGLGGSDVEALRGGEIAITPLKMPSSGSIPDGLATSLQADAG